MKKFIVLSLSDVVFIMLINVKMPTIQVVLDFFFCFGRALEYGASISLI